MMKPSTSSPVQMTGIAHADFVAATRQSQVTGDPHVPGIALHPWGTLP
jgi:hypothetical protein